MSRRGSGSIKSTPAPYIAALNSATASQQKAEANLASMTHAGRALQGARRRETR